MSEKTLLMIADALRNIFAGAWGNVQSAKEREAELQEQYFAAQDVSRAAEDAINRLHAAAGDCLADMERIAAAARPADEPPPIAPPATAPAPPPAPPSAADKEAK